MFTGIIESAATVVGITASGSNTTYRIQSDLAAELRIDQSVAHDGVCLTVIALGEGWYEVTAIEETLARTSLNHWKIGTRRDDRVGLSAYAQQRGRARPCRLHLHRVETIALLRDTEDLPTAISAYEAVYQASWKKQEPFPDFMPGLLETYAASGELRLGLAWLGDKPIAAQLWIVANGRAHIYKVAYDEAYKSYSPGTLVTAMLMQHAIDVDQVHEVDYLIGDAQRLFSPLPTHDAPGFVAQQLHRFDIIRVVKRGLVTHAGHHPDLAPLHHRYADQPH